MTNLETILEELDIKRKQKYFEYMEAYNYGHKII